MTVGVDPAGDEEEGLARTHLGAHALAHLLEVGLHAPLARAAPQMPTTKFSDARPATSQWGQQCPRHRAGRLPRRGRRPPPGW